MTTEHLAIYLAEQIEATYEAPLLPRKAAAELRRLHAELEGAVQRNRDIYGQLDKAEAEIDRLYAENEALRAALKEERRVRLLGQEPDVHWESMRDIRRACYAATDAALARAGGKT